MSDAHDTAICSFMGITHISEKKNYIIAVKEFKKYEKIEVKEFKKYEKIDH